MSLLSLKAVSVAYGGTPILEGIDLTVSAGELLGLIGPNGAGKTTLLKAMAGLLPISNGEIRLTAQAIAKIDRTLLGRTLAYLPQEGGSHWDITVKTLVMLGRLPHLGPWRAPTEADRAAVARAMDACDIAHLGRRPTTQLSGGERSRVLLARALAGEPKVLLADEPVAGLDPGHQLDVMEKLRDLAASGRAVIVVMHDLTLAARFCHRLVLLHDRRIAAEGPPEAVLAPDRLSHCYGIRAYHGSVDGNAIVVPLGRVRQGSGHAAP